MASSPPAKSPPLLQRAVHPFLLKLFTITPMPGAPPERTQSSNGSTPIDSGPGSPSGSPARLRPTTLQRSESPARSTLRHSSSTLSGRRSDSGMLASTVTAVHAAATFAHNARLTAVANSLNGMTAHRRSETGASNMLVRKAIEQAASSTPGSPNMVPASPGSCTGRLAHSSNGGGILGGRSTQVLLGDRSVAEVVANFVKPETQAFKIDYLTCLLAGKCRLDGVDVGGTFGADLHERDGTVEYWRKGTGEQIHGPATYFVSHCWGYKLGDLVNMILQHYDALPDTEGGRLYVPVYYWVDIFAVTQHFSGDFKDHPDSDFPGVIRGAPGGVLFSMAPWRNPMTVKRVWCLFEALTALSLGREINLLLDAFDSTAKVDTLLPLFIKQVIDCLDVRKAEATVESDRTYILNLAERQLGLDTFNSKLRGALQHEICEAMIIRAVMTGEQEEGRKLLDRGIIISNATLRFWPRRDSAGKEVERIRDTGLMLLAEAVKACPNLQSLVVYTGPETDVTPQGLSVLAKGLAGHPSLRHLAVGRLPLLASASGTGGCLGRSSIVHYGSLLQANPLLCNLDLSYNKLGTEGISALAQALPGNKTLQVLKLRTVCMDSSGLVVFTDAVLGCSSLRELDLSFNPDMGDRAAPSLIKLLGHRALLVLKIQSCRLGWQSGKALLGELTKPHNIKDLVLGAVMQPGAVRQDMSDWNQLCMDTGGAALSADTRAAKATSSAAARGDALVALASALRTGVKSIERLDLRGCFVGSGGVASEAAGLRDALVGGLTSVRRGAAFGSLRRLDLRSCNQQELAKIEDSQIHLLHKHGGLQLLLKDHKRNGIKGGVLRQYVQYEA